MEIKNKILNGMSDVEDKVSVTFGAMGKTVAIKDNLGLNFHLTKDGVTVARHVRVTGDEEEVGAMLIREAANKTVDEAGDGTTSTVILTKTLCQELLKQLNNGENPRKLIKELEKDLLLTNITINNEAIKINDFDDLYNIAKISANGDEQIAEIIKNIYEELGFEATIDVKDADSEETYYEVAKGFKMENTGYSNPIFINNSSKGTVEIDNPNVFILNERINDINPFTELFLAQDNPTCTPLVILCSGINETELAKVVHGMTRNQIFNTYILTSNMFYYQNEGYMYDLSKFLDGDYNTNQLGDKLGTCDKIVATKDETYFFNGAGDTSDHLKSLKETKDADEPGLLKDRILNLESGVGIVFVGGTTPSEAKERKDRVDDAVLSVKSSLEEGYVYGACSTLLKVIKTNEVGTPYKKGIESLFKTLLNNGDYNAEYYIEEMLKRDNDLFNVETGEIVSKKDSNIIESAKMLKSIFKNATSVAKTFVNLEKVI